MRRFCLSMLVLVGFLLARAPAAENAARSVAVRALESERGGPIYGTSWAVIIGINRYPQGGPLRPLQFAVADAQGVHALLVTHYGVPETNVALLLDGAATRQAILNALTDVADKAGPDDRVIVYFSGHGHTVALPDGGQRGYLVPADARLAEADLSRPARVEAQCVPMTEVRQKALLMAARHKLFLIDACYSGLAISGRAPRAIPYHLQTVAFRPMLGILAAGSAGEEAQENAELGHGAFTRKLLDGLTPVAGTLVADTEPAGEPDGVVTLKELSAYLCTAVPQITGGKQNPVDAQENEGQMLFFPVGGGTPAPAPPPLAVEQEKPQATTAALDVSSDPEGAEVVIGGEVVGTTSCRVTLPAAAGPTPYQIELRKPGYLPARLKVTATPGASGSTGVVRLERVPTLAVEPVPAPAPAPTRPPPLTPPPALPSPGGAAPPPITGKFQTWTNPKDSMEFVSVPAGEFTMGSDVGIDNERPAHKVSLPAYWIGKHEVTVLQYRLFCLETGHAMPDGQAGDDHPVVNVSWDDAVAYARWAGCRLPTEAEWEKAARGTDGRAYPWGSKWEPGKANTGEGGPGRTTPVGRFSGDASPYGCLDMAGNVIEWCSSVYEPYPYRADDGRENSNDNSTRVIRGASFDHVDRVNLRAAYRVRGVRYYRNVHVGFRCARSSK